MQENTAVQTQKNETLYDATAPQRMEFDGFDDGSIVAVIEPIPDAVYLAVYDRKAGLKVTDNGQSMYSENSDAMAALFDESVSDIEGIPGEKPENWKEQLDAGQIKVPIMAQFLSVACYDQKIGWGQTERAIVAEAYFNNEIVAGKHFLKKQAAPEDLRELRNMQKIPLVNRGKGLRGGDIKMPPFTEKKAKLYDQMAVKSAEGYANNVVPIWHKAAVIDHYFSASVSGKK